VTAWAQLDRLEAAVDTARAVAGEREQAARHAARSLDRANSAFLAFIEDVEAGARADDAEERARLEAECSAAAARRGSRSIPLGDTVVTETIDRVAEAIAAGARRAVEARERELRDFAASEFDALAAERRAQSERVTRGLEVALGAFQGAHGAYRQERDQWRRLMALRGAKPGLPVDPLQSPVRDPMRGGRLPVPIPAELRERAA